MMYKCGKYISVILVFMLFQCVLNLETVSILQIGVIVSSTLHACKVVERQVLMVL